MSVYGMDLRRKIVSALDQGRPVSSVARRFEVDEKAVRSYHRRAAADRLAPDQSGPKSPTKLTPADEERTRELRGELRARVAESMVCRTPRRMTTSARTSPQVIGTSGRGVVVLAAVFAGPQPHREAVEQGENLAAEGVGPNLRRHRQPTGSRAPHGDARRVRQ